MLSLSTWYVGDHDVPSKNVASPLESRAAQKLSDTQSMPASPLQPAPVKSGCLTQVAPLKVSPLWSPRLAQNVGGVEGGKERWPRRLVITDRDAEGRRDARDRGDGARTDRCPRRPGVAVVS